MLTKTQMRAITDSKSDYVSRPVTETFTNGFLTVDNEWKVKYWNKAAEKILGVQANDIVGKNLWGTFAEILPPEFYTVYDKAFIKDIPAHFQEYWAQKEAWFDVVTYYTGNTLSISFKSSDHPQAENQESTLKRLETITELYRFVTEITNDCLWEWNFLNKEIFWIDGGHKRVLGYPIQNALVPQIFWEDKIHPDDKDRVLEKLRITLAEGTSEEWNDQYRFKKADGEYAYVHDRGHIIYENNIASRMIGATEDITDTVELGKKLEEEMHTRQNQITAAVLTAQENEREEIGNELHENVNQVLAVANMYVQLAEKNETNRASYLRQSSDLLISVMEKIRGISKTLVIPGSHIISLFENIRILVDDITSAHPIVIEFDPGTVTESELSESFQVNIFRIIQEQVNNIIKHSEATYATIFLTKTHNQMQVIISDNGNGVDMEVEKKGVGNININSRIELYGGTVSIISKPCEGYELRIEVPLNAIA